MKKLWEQFRLFSRAKQIGVVVAIVHGTILIALFWDHFVSKTFTRLPKQIAVRTSLIPQKPIVQSPSPTSFPNPSPQKTLIPRQEKKKVVTKNPNKEKKEKPTTPSVDTSLFQQISKQLDAITTSSPPVSPKSSLSIPSLVDIKSDVSTPITSPIYSTTVATILQQNLELPEIGEVIAKIEIDSKGDVISCEILNEKSRKNAEFLKKRLRELSFPCFNEFGLTESRIDFTVTFRNVEHR